MGAEAAMHPTAATNHDRTVNANEVASALSHTDGVLNSSSQTKTTSNAASALVAATASATVDVPKNANEGVTLSSPNGPTIEISLPNSSQAAGAQQVSNGTVAYPSSDGSANAVQATNDGGVRMLTVIDNSNASTKYDYKIAVPSGGTIKVTTDGGAVVLDNAKQVIAVVEKPWAKDANGALVQTYFTTNGQTLTQVIKHDTHGVAYPVTADPRFSWGWSGVTVYFNRSETAFIGRAGGTALGALGLGGLAVGFGVQETASWGANRGYCLAVYKPYWAPFLSSWWVYGC